METARIRRDGLRPVGIIEATEHTCEQELLIDGSGQFWASFKSATETGEFLYRVTDHYAATQCTTLDLAPTMGVRK